MRTGAKSWLGRANFLEKYISFIFSYFSQPLQPAVEIADAA
jgi:hypothetical protein